jgi:hypothetical protein
MRGLYSHLQGVRWLIRAALVRPLSVLGRVPNNAEQWEEPLSLGERLHVRDEAPPVPHLLLGLVRSVQVARLKGSPATFHLALDLPPRGKIVIVFRDAGLAKFLAIVVEEPDQVHSGALVVLDEREGPCGPFLHVLVAEGCSSCDRKVQDLREWTITIVVPLSTLCCVPEALAVVFSSSPLPRLDRALGRLFAHRICIEARHVR